LQYFLKRRQKLYVMHQKKPGGTIIISGIAIPLKNKRKTGEIIAMIAIVRVDIPNLLSKESFLL